MQPFSLTIMDFSNCLPGWGEEVKRHKFWVICLLLRTGFTGLDGMVSLARETIFNNQDHDLTVPNQMLENSRI